MVTKIKKEYYFDFFENTTIIEKMSNYFQIDNDKVIDYLCKFKECDILDFIKDFDIDLNRYDSSNVSIKCKHVTTSSEGLKSFNKYGLLNLKEVLTLKTPLRDFLYENNIIIDVENKILSYKDIGHRLISHDEECDKCLYGSCKYTKDILNDSTTLTYRDMLCSYKKAITTLYVKLYKDKAETEVFISGDNKEIVDYSVIKKCPEILFTIDNIIKKIFNTNLNLQSKWEYDQNGLFYILEFYNNIKSFEFINNKELYYGYSFINEVTEYFDIDDELEDNNNFYGNLFLLQNSMYSYYGYPKEYGQLYPEAKIPFENIKIYKCSIDEI